MIISEKQDLIVSTLGWSDAGNLWILETRSGDVSTSKISDAKYLSLYAGAKGHFSVLHHYDGGNQLCISAHFFTDPAKTRAKNLLSTTEVNNPVVKLFFVNLY